MSKKLLQMTALAAAVGLASAAQASGNMRINAFGTLGVASMHGEGDDVRFGANSEYKDSETLESVTRGAVQFGYDFTDRLSGTLQLLADRGGEANGIEVNVDWAFLSYNVTDEVTVRGGVLRLPVFMLSETIDVGYSYPWVRPPQVFYQAVPFNSYYGADILWTVPLGDGDLLVQAFGGDSERQDINYVGFEDVDIDARSSYGLNLVYSFDYGSLRFGYYDVEDGNVKVQSGPQANARFTGSDVQFWSVGYNLEIGNLVTIAEFARTDSTDGTGVNFLDQVLENDSGYLTIGYRFGKLMPHVTYASNSTNDTTFFASPDGPPPSVIVPNRGDQESYILGLRYDWKPGVAIKFEYETVETTGATNGNFSGNSVSPILPPPPTFGPNPNFGNRDAEIFTISIDYVL